MTRSKGSVMQRKRDGRWYARLRVKDKNTGETKQLFRFARDKAHAERLLSQMIAEAHGAGTESPLSAFSEQTNTITFRQLAHAYSEHKVTPAVYRNNRKVSGMRPEGERTTRIRIAVLVEYFGETPVASITVGSVEKFKTKRLATPTHHGTERTMASVNRELESLRAILRFAENEDIISASPFKKSSTPIISKAFETKRERVLSEDEEIRLLEQCQKPRRKHLYPVVVAALDTGARRGELLAIRWSDINALKRRITLRSMTTKTQKTRIVPLSGRFLTCLYQMCGKVEKGKDRGGLPVNDDPVFNLRKFQNGWDAACEDAKIEDLRFHDLRATFATRLIARGVPLEEVSKITGHTQLSTLYAHYIRNTSDTVARVTRLLDGDEDE